MMCQIYYWNEKSQNFKCNLFQVKITVLISILINHIDIRVQFVRVQFVELKDAHEFSLRNLSGFNQRTICQWPQGSCRESNYSFSTVHRNSEIVRTLETKSKTEDQCLKWIFLDSVLRWVMVTRFGLCFKDSPSSENSRSTGSMK